MNRLVLRVVTENAEIIVMEDYIRYLNTGLKTSLIPT